MEYLSNIELYYTLSENFSSEKIILAGEDFLHSTKVMRHKQGDIIFVTNGEGKIAKCEITAVNRDHILLIAKELFLYQDEFKKTFFCLPRLKSSDRFEFAIEKSVELGITRFIIYDADRAVAKGNKIERWNKIARAAMKQSLRSYLPEFYIAGRIDYIAGKEGKKYLFEQSGENLLNKNNKEYDGDSYFIFGPEGGLNEKEINMFNREEIYKLSDTRLRSETAIIVCASRL